MVFIKGGKQQTMMDQEVQLGGGGGGENAIASTKKIPKNEFGLTVFGAVSGGQGPSGLLFGSVIDQL